MSNSKKMFKQTDILKFAKYPGLKAGETKEYELHLPLNYIGTRQAEKYVNYRHKKKRPLYSED